MLFDPKWEQKTETKPTFEGFVQWLEMQPARKRYVWGDCQSCAIAQYIRGFGIESINDVPYEKYNELEGGFGDKDTEDGLGTVAISKPHTFGAALARARAVLASRL